MSRDGSGNYSLPTNTWNPAVNGVSASAADWQTLINDLASAMTQSVSKDGQTTMTGNLPMGNTKLTGLAAGTAAGDSLRFQQLFSQGAPATLASAGTVDIGAQNSVAIEITGTTTITSLGTNYNGPRFLRFTGVLTLTHNATTLNLPGAVNIVTAAGDTCIAYPNSTSNGWNIVQYQQAVVPSMIRLNTANGYGSTNTKIRRFTNTVTSQGADITYADSATLGASFTIVNSGVYAISFGDSFSGGASNCGISLNTTTPTTDVYLINISELLALNATAGANFGTLSNWTGYLSAGSIIRAHTNGASVGAIAQYTQFTITRV